MSTVKFKRSGVKDKKPLASQLTLGEIAINFNAQNPFISTLTSDGTVAEFPSKEGVQGLIDDALEEYQPGSGGTVDAYTKAETDSLLSGKSDVNHEHSQYLTASDIEGKADKSELNNYLTTSAASSTYATKTDLNGKADSVHSHSYNDLTDKPVIPSIEGLETSAHAEATYQPKGDYLTQTSADERYAQIGDTPTDVYTKTETNQLLAGKANSAHTHDYETLTNKPDLSNFATKGEIPDTSNFITSGFCEDHYQPKGTYVVPSDLNDYALKSEVPDSYTKTETDNLLAAKANSGHSHPQYVTSGDVETMISGKTNIWTGTLAQYQTLEDKDDNTIYCITDTNYQYLTLEQAEELFQPQSGMSAYASSSHTHSYNDLTDKPDLSVYLTEHQDISGKADKTDLANYQPISGMSGYLTTSDASETYQPKGNYLTEHQDISGKADKSELNDYLKVSAATETYATKDELAAYASSSHTHTSSDITDLSTTLAGYSTSSHTHSYNDLTDKPVIPSTEGLATKAELENYQQVSAMTDYQTVANMSGYVTTSAATATYATKTELSGYARVVSISQSDYDTLVSNDQVQQGVLYCIIESSN